jgi:hypothetical protein
MPKHSKYWQVHPLVVSRWNDAGASYIEKHLIIVK